MDQVRVVCRTTLVRIASVVGNRKRGAGKKHEKPVTNAVAHLEAMVREVMGTSARHYRRTPGTTPEGPGVILHENPQK